MEILAICRNSKIFYIKVIVEECLNQICLFDFFLDNPLIAPIMTKAESHVMLSIFYLDNIWKVYSYFISP